jgi:hypothetical protein
MKRRNQPWRSVTIGLLLCAAAATAAGAQTRSRIYSLVEKTRQAPVIVAGEITELRTDSVVLKVRAVIKGEPGASMVLSWIRRGTVEQQAAAHVVGDQLLVFATPGGAGYDPLGGAQGTVKLDAGQRDQYDVAVRRVLAFDATADRTGKTSGLVEMLGGTNRFALVSALDIAYLEFHSNRFDTEPLIAPALRLAQTGSGEVAVRAVQLLGRIGDKSVISPLIQLMAAPDPTIAQTAFTAVKGLTNAPLAFDPRQSREARAAATKQWAEWWDSNRESIVLIK